jgi:hypothetical protein
LLPSTHRFRVGSEVNIIPSKIRKSDGGVNLSIQGVVSKVASCYIEVIVNSVRDEFVYELINEGAAVRLDQLPNETTHRKMCESLKRVVNYGNGDEVENRKDAGVASLREVLLGLQPPTSQPMGDQHFSVYNQGLDQSQTEAIEFALRSNDVALIHG